ncbi:heavy-metal-associated domain-containing protein [Neobacillus sp. SM06]|uniref:heavy-metal-associated domain-containing protein n=1 Tax=Neobacillus sp. SM06 TaxID=3422492 RepID=UPI003D2DE897
MTKIQLPVNDMACSGCIRKIKKRIKQIPGVEGVQIIAGQGHLHVLFNKQMVQQDEIVRSLNHFTLRAFD